MRSGRGTLSAHILLHSYFNWHILERWQQILFIIRVVNKLKTTRNYFPVLRTKMFIDKDKKRISQQLVFSFILHIFVLARESGVVCVLKVPLDVQHQVQLVLEPLVTEVGGEGAGAVHFVLVVVEARLELGGVRAAR
jgi:hypothetical protein